MQSSPVRQEHALLSKLAGGLRKHSLCNVGGQRLAKARVDIGAAAVLAQPLLRFSIPQQRHDGTGHNVVRCKLKHACMGADQAWLIAGICSNRH